MEHDPYFCLAIFWGPPTWWLPSQVPRTQTRKQQLSLREKGQLMGTRMQVHKSQSQDLMLTNVFLANLNLERKGRYKIASLRLYG